MDRMDMLKEQARLLRDLAVRSDITYPEIARRMRDLADQCDQLAEALSESFSMAQAAPLEKRS